MSRRQWGGIPHPPRWARADVMRRPLTRAAATAPESVSIAARHSASPMLTVPLVTRRNGIPVTTPARTIADLRVVSRHTWSDGRAGRRCSSASGSRRSSNGTALAATWSRLPAPLPPSPAAAPRSQRPVGSWTVDFLWRERRLVVETDGYLYHRGEERVRGRPRARSRAAQPRLRGPAIRRSAAGDGTGSRSPRWSRRRWPSSDPEIGLTSSLLGLPCAWPRFGLRSRSRSLAVLTLVAPSVAARRTRPGPGRLALRPRARRPRRPRTAAGLDRGAGSRTRRVPAGDVLAEDGGRILRPPRRRHPPQGLARLVPRRSTGKAAFKVKFDEYVDDQTFFGLEKLTLNNMVQDRSMIHETLAYELFRAARRAGLADRLRVRRASTARTSASTSTSRPSTTVSLPRWFASTRHLYEGALRQRRHARAAPAISRSTRGKTKTATTSKR